MKYFKEGVLKYFNFHEIFKIFQSEIFRRASLLISKKLKQNLSR